MPYPILNLPYGLQQRLCALATPREKYLLQTATGLMQHHLKPIQSTVNLSNQHSHILHKHKGTVELITFSADGVSYEYFPKFDNSHSKLITLKSTLRLEELTENELDDTFFNHTLLRIQTLSFVRTSANDSVLQRISTNCLSPIIKYHAGYVKDGNLVNIGRLFTLFPYLQDIQLCESMNVNKNWLRDILKLENQKLNTLSLQGTVDNLISFNSNELVQLFMTRRDMFLELCVTDNPSVDAIAKISTLINKECFKTATSCQRPVLHLRFSNPLCNNLPLYYNFRTQTSNVN
uniref:F-box domain-containing protein n=1 Tax=Panagrellus redivivus TaxID=6233 RepID=A0A7E4UTV6_PANRE